MFICEQQCLDAAIFLPSSCLHTFTLDLHISFMTCGGQRCNLITHYGPARSYETDQQKCIDLFSPSLNTKHTAKHSFVSSNEDKRLLYSDNEAVPARTGYKNVPLLWLSLSLSLSHSLPLSLLLCFTSSLHFTRSEAQLSLSYLWLLINSKVSQSTEKVPVIVFKLIASGVGSTGNYSFQQCLIC